MLGASCLRPFQGPEGLALPWRCWMPNGEARAGPPSLWDSLSDESEDELASRLVALGYDAEDLPELRRLIRGSVAAVARDRRTFTIASDA